MQSTMMHCSDTKYSLTVQDYRSVCRVCLCRLSVVSPGEFTRTLKSAEYCFSDRMDTMFGHLVVFADTDKIEYMRGSSDVERGQ